MTTPNDERTTTTSSAFMDLPIEVRLNIYAHLAGLQPPISRNDSGSYTQSLHWIPISEFLTTLKDDSDYDSDEASIPPIDPWLRKLTFTDNPRDFVKACGVLSFLPFLLNRQLSEELEVHKILDNITFARTSFSHDEQNVSATCNIMAPFVEDYQDASVRLYVDTTVTWFNSMLDAYLKQSGYKSKDRSSHIEIRIIWKGRGVFHHKKHIQWIPKSKKNGARYNPSKTFKRYQKLLLDRTTEVISAHSVRVVRKLSIRIAAMHCDHAREVSQPHVFFYNEYMDDTQFGQFMDEMSETDEDLDYYLDYDDDELIFAEYQFPWRDWINSDFWGESNFHGLLVALYVIHGLTKYIKSALN